MRVRVGAAVVNELGVPLRDVRRQAGDPLQIVELAVPFGDRFVPVVGEGPLGEVIDNIDLSVTETMIPSSPVYLQHHRFVRQFIPVIADMRKMFYQMLRHRLNAADHARFIV